MTTVMIVEDEPLIRSIGAEILGDAGYEVIEADDAGEAMDLLEHDSDVDLLFTDIRMPGPMDGLQLAERVHDRWPEIQLLVTSGHMCLSNQDIPDSGEFLPKPYLWSELTRKVQTLLSRKH